MGRLRVVDLFVLTSFAVFIFAVFGLHNYVTNFEDNGCEMTYMFEYPQYVKIFFPPDISSKFSRYGLYAYGEGQFTENLRKMKFSGIPVLFIPGNSGSYKQVRSLASISLRKGIKSRMPFHFDYFSVDLNEEYSGLFGGLLEDQTQFVYHCIQRILQLYIPSATSPRTVVLIGHSMGGLVAKGLFLKPYFDANQVQVIITLATPHKHTVISLDHHLASYHSRVKSYWSVQKKNSSGNVNHVTLISVGGGQRDILVRSSLTVAEEADVSVVSTGIPGVWLSTDHLSTLWCKELILVIVRSLFDIVDIRYKQITYNSMERKNAFEYHLLKRTAGKRLELAYHTQKAIFDPNGNWLEYLRRQFSILEPNGVPKVTYVMVRLLDDPKHEWLLAEAVNNEANDWVFACVADRIYGSSRVCDNGINLSNQTQLLPSSTYRRKIVYIHLAHYKKLGYSHVILRVLPTKELVFFNIDIHSSSRKLTVSLPHILNFMKNRPLLESTDDAAVYYEVALPAFEFVWQAFYLHINPHSCRLANHHAVGVMHVPWNEEDLYININELVEKPMQLRLQSPKPMAYKGNDTVKVTLLLDPTCKYSVSFQGAFLDSLGQLVRFHGPMILSYVSAVLLLTLRSQLLSFDEGKSCTMFHTALTCGAKPYYILPVVRITIQVLSIGILTKLLKAIVIPFDPATLIENNLDFLLLSVILYMTAFAVTYIAALACWLAIIFNGSAANKMALRFLAKTITGTVTWSEWMLATLSTLPITAACILIGLTYITCGALSLCVGGAFFFLKLSKMYENYLEDVFKYSVFLLSKMKPKRKRKEKNTETEDRATQEPASKPEVERKDSNSKILSLSENKGTQNEHTELMEQGSNLPSERSTEEPCCSEVSPTDDPVKKDEPEKPEKGITEKDVSKSHGMKRDDNRKDCDEVENLLKDAENQKSGVDKDSNDDKKEKCPELSDLSVLHFNFTLLLLWIIITVINIPSVLVWAHNYRFSSKLDPDPSFETSIVLSVCVGVLWQKGAPNPFLKHYRLVGLLLYTLAVIVLIFTTLSLHHLSPLLMLAFVVVTCHQVLAARLPESSASPNSYDESNADNAQNVPSRSGEKVKQL